MKNLVEVLKERITKMENVESGSDYEIWKDKDGTLYEIDYDGLDLLGIFKVDQDRNILEEIYRSED